MKHRIIRWRAYPTMQGIEPYPRNHDLFVHNDDPINEHPSDMVTWSHINNGPSTVMSRDVRHEAARFGMQRTYHYDTIRQYGGMTLYEQAARNNIETASMNPYTGTDLYKMAN